jgi:hypothetical protein
VQVQVHTKAQAVLALPPDGPRTHPPFEEVREFARAVIEHGYVEGKDAKTAFTATGDWDEAFLKQFPIPSYGGSLITWLGSEAANSCRKDSPHIRVTWMHACRSIRPEEWRAWKYRVPEDWESTGPRWDPVLDLHD